MQDEVHRVQEQLHGSLTRGGVMDNHAKKDDRGSAFDAAVEHLRAASRAGQLPGFFHGRLRDVLRVLQPRAVTAVNAALSAQCSLVPVCTSIIYGA